MRTDVGPRSQASRAGSVSRAASSQLSRRASSSHLPSRHSEHHRRPRPPERQGKLVLVFLLLVFGSCFVIIQRKADRSHSGAHRKDLQAKSQVLQGQVTGDQHLQQLGTKDAAAAANAELQSAAQKFKEQQGQVTHVISLAADSAASVGSDPKPPPLQDPSNHDHASSHTTTEHSLHSSLSAEEKDFSPAGLDRKREQVKAAAAHSWRGYEQHAWGFDELQPITQDGKDSLGGLGATIVDSLDTLWLMGLKDEFARAREWVSTQLDCNTSRRINLFETNIRVVGGLLGAFELTADPLFLDKAAQCVDLMLPIFNTSRSGIPNNMVSLKSTGKKKPRQHGSMVSLAEYGSFGVEFLTLSERTGNITYAQKAEAIYRWLDENFPGQGLLPIRLNRNRGTFTPMKTYTVGAMADSYYEYLLKMWLFKQQKDEMYRRMWEVSMDDMMTKLMNVSASGLLYVGMIQHDTMFMPRLEHLTCYLPGNLALGAASGAVNGSKADHYMAVAKNLTYSCWQMYERMPSGLAPELVGFNPENDMQAGSSPSNQLRPEVLESFFYMWRFTGDPVYQQWAWQIFQSFEKYCRVDAGYAGLEDVTAVPPVHDNIMQSFWLAETLKYLYLLFSPSDLLPLDKWLLTTEAHPVRLPRPLKLLLRPFNQYIVPLV